MVSLRCKLSVKDKLDALGIIYGSIELGAVQILSEITTAQMEKLNESLVISGFEILEDKKNILVEKIKAIIIEMVHYEDHLPKTNFSIYITSKLFYDYTYLANVFSEIKGSSIERYIIMHKVERIKELLEYDELSLTEIAFKLHYSSVSHLSNQFKKITGITPTGFKAQKHRTRINLENL